MICVNILPAEVNESVGWCWWCCGTVPAKLPRHTVFDLYFSKSGWILWSTWPKEHHLADSRAGRMIKSWFYRSLIHYPKEIQCYFVNHQSHSKIFLLEFQSEKILNLIVCTSVFVPFLVSWFWTCVNAAFSHMI